MMHYGTMARNTLAQVMDLGKARRCYETGFGAGWSLASARSGRGFRDDTRARCSVNTKARADADQCGPAQSHRTSADHRARTHPTLHRISLLAAPRSFPARASAPPRLRDLDPRTFLRAALLPARSPAQRAPLARRRPGALVAISPATALPSLTQPRRRPCVPSRQGQALHALDRAGNAWNSPSARHETWRREERFRRAREPSKRTARARTRNILGPVAAPAPAPRS